MVSVRYILLLGLILNLFIVPNFAIEDLTNETYITPAYKIAISGDYKYTRDNVINWQWAYPNFDYPSTTVNGDFTAGTLGTYPVFKKGDDVEVGICIESSFTGTLYLMVYYRNENGVDFIDEYVVKEITTSSACATKTIEMKNDYYGNIEYRWEFFSGGIWRYSDVYTLFLYENLNSNWKYRKIIQLTTTEKWDEGTIKIKLNDTFFHNHTNTKYDIDDDEDGFSGTITDIIITDEQQTKVYPYFIDTYKGGFYNYSRESSNDTYIVTYLNENKTAGTLYIYYGYEVGYDYPYMFGHKDNDFLHTDFLNNPFGIYQVFSDYRWTENFYKSNIGSFTFGGNEDSVYERTLRLKNYCNKAYGCAGWFDTILKFKNAITYFETIIKSQYYTFGGSYVYIFSYNNSHYLYKKEDSDSKFYNSTNDFVNVSLYYPNSRQIYKINLENNNLSINATDDVYAGHSDLVWINEELVYFTIEKLSVRSDTTNSNSGYTDSEAYLYKFFNLVETSVSYTIGNETTTEYAIIQFLDMNEYDSFINDLWIGGYLTVDSKGVFYCFDVNGSVLGSVELTKSLLGITTYNIVFPYTLTNKTEFLNRTNFIYNCKFISESGLYGETDNLTINFTTNRIFLDTIKPYSQYNYSSEYVAYNINSELNYTGVQTDFSLTTNKIQCLETNDEDECLNFNYLSGYNYFNTSNITVNYNYYNVYQFDVNNWYQQYYQFCRSGTCLSTPSRLFYVYKAEEIISFPVVDFLDWNDTDLTENKEFMSNKFWDNPLNWMSSFVYQKFIITQITDEKTLDIFKYTFLIFWSFWFVILMIGAGIAYEFRENGNVLKIAGFGVMPFVFLFSYLGWLGIDILSLVILLICVLMVYLWQQK